MTRLPQGGAGGFDLNSMMKQVQQVQADMTEAQEKLKDEVVEASAGGGMVKVKMSGDLRLLELAIDPEAIDPEDAELLQDMIIAAVNEALRSAQELASTGSAGRRRLGGARPRPGLGDRRAPGRPLACRACTQPDPAADRGAREAAGDRPAHRAAARLPRPARRGRRRVRARRRDPRGEGEGRPLRGLLQPRRGPALRDLRGRAPRPAR